LNFRGLDQTLALIHLGATPAKMEGQSLLQGESSTHGSPGNQWEDCKRIDTLVQDDGARKHLAPKQNGCQIHASPAHLNG
jgi:hypothetical protein